MKISEPSLKGKVALVTGATRGVGKGVAVELVQAGAIVYGSGRTITDDNLLSENGVITVRCDHTRDSDVEELFGRINAEQDHLDILVNNAWGGYEGMIENGEFTWVFPFWKQPLWRWDAMFAAGVRAAYVASSHAARRMVTQRSGLIVNISFWAAQKHLSNVAYGVSKAATDKMTSDMSHELREYNVAVVSLYPGLVRTEKVMEAAAYLDLSNSESPEFIGRSVTALASDPDIMQKTGQVCVAAVLGQEYDFADVDGKRPRPINLAEL